METERFFPEIEISYPPTMSSDRLNGNDASAATIKLMIDSNPSLSSPTAALNQPRHSSFAIFTVVAFYWVSSLSVVFLNKFILSSSEHKFPYPLLVTWFQLLVALVLLYTLGVLGRAYKVFSVIPPFEFNPILVSRIWPLTLVYVMMLALNNLCLQYVEVTFYQVHPSHQVRTP